MEFSLLRELLLRQFEQEINEVRRQEHEQERAATELKRVESKFQQELKKLSDANLQRQRAQQQVITKLEQEEKKCSSLVKSLRSNLAEKQQQLVTFDERVSQLETQVLKEQHVSASRKIRVEELENDIQRVTKELETEKAKREEALAKISALEHVISVTTKDLDFERQRLRDARGKIMDLKKKLRAFCTTTEEVNHLFDKQQEKLEEMNKALQEKQNDQINASTEDDPNRIEENSIVGATIAKETGTTSHTSNGTMEPKSTSSIERAGNNVGDEASSDDNNVGETHDQV